MTAKRWATDPAPAAAWGCALLFFTLSSWASYCRWANFQYRTFDLAYYVQALWQLIHGRFELSLAGVPLLGNHVEPIVFLLAPLIALFHHPMTFVVVQNAALAAMAPLALAITRRLGLARTPGLFLAIAVLLTPAAGYVALHEFHPEAFTAPLLLLMIWARLRGSLPVHWTAAIALVACKENMALLLAAYGAVHLVLERKRPWRELMPWYLGPLVLAIVWFLLCTKVITPTLNSGEIDYLALYDRLGTSGTDILMKSFSDPGRILTALSGSLRNGNLIWGLLLPFLGLPLLRPRWLLIGLPIALQHLLSWRSSEWQIYFHYGAPLLALSWVALAEFVAGLSPSRPGISRLRNGIPALVLGACIAAQIVLGPAGAIFTSLSEWSSTREERTRKQAVVDQISQTASVVAPLPYLSHLAMREKLYSLHYILKGLKTLSRASYDPPPPTDFVLIDYDDSATFDAGAGYYHPAMQTVDGRVIPSSDQLLHEFLRRSAWTVDSSNELALFRKASTAPEPGAPPVSSEASRQLDLHTRLDSIARSSDELTSRGIEIRMDWFFQEERNVFPWMRLKLTRAGDGRTFTIQKGLCAPEQRAGPYQERWRVVSTSALPSGDYDVEAIFLDNTRLRWAEKTGASNVPAGLNSNRVSLGRLKVPAKISGD